MDELSRQHEHGVFLRREALEHGYSDKDLRRALAAGQLVKVRHGAYASAADWQASDAVERHAMAAHAVGLSHPSQIAISHVSGAALHGLGLWRTDLARVHVSRMGAKAARKHHGVAYHDAPPMEAVEQVAGTAVLPQLWCALETAAMSSVESGLAVLDSAYHRGNFTTEQMRAVYDQMRGWPGTARLQVTLRLASRGAESVGESRTRYLFWAHGLPRPLLQYKVYDGRSLAGITDFAWPEHKLLGEFDGRVKYGRLRRPGESPEDALWREKQREDRLREITGWKMIRFIWSDLGVARATAARTRGALGL